MHRVGKCFGVPIWRWNKTYIELWCCLSGVGPHIHPEQTSEIVPVFGWATFVRQNPDIPINISKNVAKIGMLQWLRPFTVPANWPHWFSTRFLIFLNISDRSAAENIVYE